MAFSLRDFVRRQLRRGEAPTFSEGDNAISSNEFYRVMIESSATDIEIKAYLPEEFQFAVESNWDAQIFKLGGFGKLLHMLKGKTLHEYYLFWDGTSPISMTLPLEFRARTNAWTDVVEPCMNLQKLALPYGTGRLLHPPGPIPQFEVGGKSVSSDIGDNISITIGAFIKFTRVVLSHVEVQWRSQMSKEGYPMRATANVQFQTSHIMTREELDKVYTKNTPAKVANPTLRRHLKVPGFGQ